MARKWTSLDTAEHVSAWKEYEKIIFRFFFLYFVLQAVPLDWKFYRDLFAIDWADLHYSDIFYIAHYTPQFFSGDQTFANWGVIAGIAAAGTVIWTLTDRTSLQYNDLYYWLRVILRYRLAIALFAYGFIKFFPLQSPYPSLSNLNTRYGEISHWKVFSLSLGIVPDYESFLGLIELIAAALLLYRKTATIGAFLILAFVGNIFVSNLAYEGGEYVYSLYLISLAAFLLAFDTRRLLQLFSYQVPTAPNTYKPVFREDWLRYTRWGLQAFAIVFFVVLYGAKTYAAYKDNSAHYPTGKGLPGVTGLYSVASYQVNKDSIPYSATHPSRWQDVVFEKWNTVSVRSNRPVIPDTNKIESPRKHNQDRTHELEGTIGRHYYAYTVDSVHQTLTLKNRNSHYANEILVLHYSRPSDRQLILSGLDEKQDSIKVVLEKVNKLYLLEEVKKTGRGKSIKL